MSTRAGAAGSSRHVKQTLVRLLFGEKLTRKGPEAHRKLDSTIYSFEDLRKAYLVRIQAIHPDKNHKKDSSQFVQLQDAWHDYEASVKMMNRVGSPRDASFTMFGVGCSFSDSTEERARRDEIMDQACRGWFSAGSLPDETTGSTQEESNRATVSLCDDDMFVATISDEKNDADSVENNRPKKTLIPPGFKPTVL